MYGDVLGTAPGQPCTNTSGAGRFGPGSLSPGSKALLLQERAQSRNTGKNKVKLRIWCLLWLVCIKQKPENRARFALFDKNFTHGYISRGGYMRTFLLIMAFLVAGTPLVLPLQAQTITNPHRRDTVVRLANPVQTKQELILINTLTGDGTPKVARKFADQHDGSPAEFRVYDLRIVQGRGELGEELMRLRTQDDYCVAIEFRDVNGDGHREIIFYTTSRDRLHNNMYIVRYDRQGAAFLNMSPDVPFATLQARYSFKPGTAALPAEVIIDSVLASRDVIFSAPTPIRGELPQFWLRQVYRAHDTRLSLYESAALETPYYALSSMLLALSDRDFFASYKYAFTDAAYEVYRRDIQNLHPLLIGKRPGARFLLNEWNLELQREQQNQGWMNFTHIFQDGGRERQITYQAFMRKIYDEWKITSIRRLRES
jgi:hypothetical protein